MLTLAFPTLSMRKASELVTRSRSISVLPQLAGNASFCCIALPKEGRDRERHLLGGAQAGQRCQHEGSPASLKQNGSLHASAHWEATADHSVIVRGDMCPRTSRSVICSQVSYLCRKGAFVCMHGKCFCTLCMLTAHTELLAKH